MDSFELNKIIGAVLGTLLFVMGVGFLAEAIYHPIEDRGPGYALPEPEATASAGAAAAPAAPEVPLATLLASANADDGAAAAKKCQACHDFTDGGPNKTGPNLYDVVERPIGSHPGFSYSDGMLEHNKKGDIWSYENLNAFITSPKTFTPGTKMTFSGIKDPQERANVLAYLQTLSHDPKPFPQPEAAAPAEQPAAAAPAEQPAAGAQPAAEQPASGAEQPAAAPATPAPAPATETPTTPSTETPVEGTPTNSQAAPANDNTAQPAATTPSAPAAATGQ